MEGVRALKSAFPDLIVRPVEVGPGGLHLKSGQFFSCCWETELCVDPT